MEPYSVYTLMDRYDVVIVGSGHGGAHAAISLRQFGFDGSIVVITSDQVLPYERPPLSKEYLAREKPFERLLIRPEGFWQDKNIELVRGIEVSAIDPERYTVELSDGRFVQFGELVWAAGGVPRKLNCQGADLNGVLTMRSKPDADQVMQALDAGAKRVVVIGGGYIGLEAAAVLNKLECEVVIVEALDRVLSRVAGEEVAQFIEAEHRSHGVTVRLNVSVDCIEGANGNVTGVRLADGKVLPCDLVIVGIGILPAIEPLQTAGAVVTNGVEVDEYCRTSLPNVYAIGDCAAHDNAFAHGQRVRLESVQNATDMASVVAKSICGNAVSYNAVPWFWSNQYDIKLLTVGLSQGCDATVIRGDRESRSFSVIYMRDGKVIALDCINAMKDYAQGRKLVEAGLVANTEELADTDTALKDLLTQKLDR